MSNDEPTEKQGFKVTDRRRFDSTGKERGDGEATAKVVSNSSTARSESAAQPRPAASAAVGHAGAKNEAVLSENSQDTPMADEEALSFSSFVISLATQALMQLGQMPTPDGVPIPVDREAAKQTIEIIAMLQLKTRGNLQPDETRLLQEVLHNLRLAYVKVR